MRFFDLFDVNGELRGSFYLDLYARENKRGGARMDDCVGSLRKADGTLQKPVAYLTCNFNRPLGDQPALFTHNEVTTLFHEFGHGLHHMLTQIDTAGVSGINGVPWDAVELPSQFMENWCWEPEALAFISGHYQSGEPLPKAMLDKLLAAKITGRRCSSCASWSSACSISACTSNTARKKGRRSYRRWRK